MVNHILHLSVQTAIPRPYASKSCATNTMYIARSVIHVGISMSDTCTCQCHIHVHVYAPTTEHCAVGSELFLSACPV